MNDQSFLRRPPIAGQRQRGPEPCDGELLRRARNGETSAFEQLVERHRDQVYSLSLWMTQSEKGAAEIAQETFLSAYRHLKEFRDEAELGAWVRRTAAIHARLQPPAGPARRDQARDEPLQPDGSLPECPASDWSGRAEEEPLNIELRQEIEKATDQLPQDDRQVFLFKDLAGLSFQEIADIRSESIPVIRSRLRHARLTLQKAIDRFYSQA